MDAVTIGGMFLLGWLSGYVTKLIRKVALLILGAQAVFLLWLERQGIITINYAQVWEHFSNLLNFSTDVVLQYLPVGIPYACGFILGMYFPRTIVPKGRRKYITIGG